MSRNTQYLIGVAYETLEKGAEEFKVAIEGTLITGKAMDSYNSLTVTWPRKVEDGP